MLSWTEAVKHEVDHGDADHRLAAGGQRFVILAQAAVLAQPREGALDNPSFGQHYETADRRRWNRRCKQTERASGLVARS